MKTDMTDEQKQKTEERRKQFRAIAKQLADMQPLERDALAAKMLGVVTVEGRALSLHNTYLLALQNPRATMVGGFKQWIKAKRVVRKGEHGAMIWFPMKRKESESAEPQGDEDLRFGMTTVFDVSQTDELVTPNNPYDPR